MTHDEIIAVVQAHKAGKTIQIGSKHEKALWYDTANPTWNFAHFNFRVKPEPRIIYVNEYKTTQIIHAYHKEETADAHADIDRICCTKYIEAIE